MAPTGILHVLKAEWWCGLIVCEQVLLSLSIFEYRSPSFYEVDGYGTRSWRWQSYQKNTDVAERDTKISRVSG